MKKVVKFGGSSLASARQFKKVKAIIEADKTRCYVVPSAPEPESSHRSPSCHLPHQAEVRIVGNDGTNRKLSVKGDGSFVLPINPHVDYLVINY